MKNKISQNLQLNLFITLFTGILGFVSNKYFSEYMGMDNLGLMRLFSQLIAYLSLAELGVGTASTYALYKPLLEKDYNRLNIVVSTINLFYKKIAGFIIIVGLLLNITIPFFVKSNIEGKFIYLYWSLYVVNTAIGYTFAKYSIIFTANQEYSFVRKVQGIGRILFQSIQIVSLIYIRSFTIFILILILENVFNYYFYKKHYIKNYSYIDPTEERDKGIIQDIKSLFWHKIGTLVVYNTDYIVLSKFTNLSIVAIYSSYLIVYQMILAVVNIISPVLTPQIGKYIAENNKYNICIYWRKLYSLYMMLGTILIFTSFKVINPFIELWLGKEYLLPKVTVILILMNLFVNITRGVTDIFKNNSGFFDDTYVPALESGINLVLSITLVQKMELNGVIIGTVVSNVLIIYLLKPILVFRRCFDKKGIDYIKDLTVNLSLVGISFLVSEIILRGFIEKMNFSTWLNWIISSAMIGVVVSLVSLTIFMLNGSFRKIFFEIFKLDRKLALKNS